MPIGIQVFIMIFYGAIFLVGLINAVNPRFMWETFESWKATKEPTAAYFRVRRIQGVVIMLIITAVAFGPYIMSRIN